MGEKDAERQKKASYDHAWCVLSKNSQKKKKHKSDGNVVKLMHNSEAQHQCSNATTFSLNYALFRRASNASYI